MKSSKCHRQALRLAVLLPLLTGGPAWAASLSEAPGQAAYRQVDAAATDRAAMQTELHNYLQLSEQALGMRAAAIRLYQELHAKHAGGEALNGQDLLRVNQGARDLLVQRRTLLEQAMRHECWALSPPAGAGEAAELQRAGVLISLSAALTLYDNYLSAIALYRNDSGLRQHLNREDKGFVLPAGELQRTDEMFNSSANRARVRRVIVWYQRHARGTRSSLEGYDYLVQSIEQSPSYRMVQKKLSLENAGRNFEVFSTQTVDTLVGLKEEGTHLFSLLFGNTVGLVETRKGKLYRQPQVASRIAHDLEAGDILLEKTPFRLTDTFIPGHWGHAAIWVGSEAELRELGLWDHPVLKPHQASIRAGHGVVEALRSGVEMNSLEHFLNVDDLAVLRQSTLPAEKRREILIQTLRQVGKAYDFNFNAETTHRVFCSKLVYLAYGDLHWPTSRVFGRFTISPDDIAQRATGDGPLNVVQLYHDGAAVENEPRRIMESLLAGRALEVAPQNPGQRFSGR